MEIHWAKGIVFGDVEAGWWEGWKVQECFHECDRVGNQSGHHQSRCAVADSEESLAG